MRRGTYQILLVLNDVLFIAVTTVIQPFMSYITSSSIFLLAAVACTYYSSTSAVLNPLPNVCGFTLKSCTSVLTIRMLS